LPSSPCHPLVVQTGGPELPRGTATRHRASRPVDPTLSPVVAFCRSSVPAGALASADQPDRSRPVCLPLAQAPYRERAGMSHGIVPASIEEVP
jgi:hypothetical protein